MTMFIRTAAMAFQLINGGGGSASTLWNDPDLWNDAGTWNDVTT